MSKTPSPDQSRSGTLVARRRALEVLVERERHNAVARLCRAVSQADAEDLYQEACLRALERLPQQRQPSQLRAWFNTVQRTVISQKAAPQPLALTTLALESLPAETKLRRCRCGLDVLATLSTQQQELLRGAVLEGQSSALLASAAATTANNIRVQLHRARVQLRTLWERRCGMCIHDDHGAGCACPPLRDTRLP